MDLLPAFLIRLLQRVEPAAIRLRATTARQGALI